MGLSSFTNIPDPKRYRRYTAWQIDPAGRPIRQILLHQDEPHDQEDTPEDLVLVAIPQHLHSPYWDRAANKWKEGNMGHRVWSITRWLTLPFLLTLLWVAQSQAAAIPQFQFPKPFVYGYPIYTYLAQQGVGSGGLGGLPGGGGTTSPLTTKGDLYTYSTVDARLAIGADALCLVADSAEATGIKWAACGSGSAHDLLSVTHGDTLGAAVTRGSIIIGNVTPAWSELVIGAANTFLGSDGTDAAWTGLTLAGAQFVNQGTTTTVLHGNAAGNPSFGAIDLTADVTGVLPDANVANNITIDLAAAATALAADPTNCAASSAAGGITAAGTAEACIAPLLLTGGTMTGAANFVAGTTSIPSFNIATGVAKTTPAAGDFWINGNRLHVYLNSVDETVAHVSELFAAATDDTILVDSGAAFQAKLLAGGALAYTLATNAFSQATCANLSDGAALCAKATTAAGDYGAASIDGDDVASGIAGDGLILTVAAPDTLDLDLNATLDGVGAISNLSGMEFTATAELALLQGCANNEILKWVDAGATWDCAADASGTGAGTSSTTEILYNTAGSIDGISIWTTNGTTTITGAATGILDAGAAASLELPNAAAPTTDATGEIALDTTITSHQPMFQYFDGGENMTVIAIDTAQLPALDNEIVKYDSGTSKFVLEADAGGSGIGTIFGHGYFIPQIPASVTRWYGIYRASSGTTGPSATEGVMANILPVSGTFQNLCVASSDAMSNNGTMVITVYTGATRTAKSASSLTVTIPTDATAYQVVCDTSNSVAVTSPTDWVEYQIVNNNSGAKFLTLLTVQYK